MNYMRPLSLEKLLAKILGYDMISGMELFFFIEYEYPVHFPVNQRTRLSKNKIKFSAPNHTHCNDVFGFFDSVICILGYREYVN